MLEKDMKEEIKKMKQTINNLYKSSHTNAVDRSMGSQSIVKSVCK